MHEVRQKGMILLMTLSMIIIISILLLSHMQQVLLYAKALGQQNNHYDNLKTMESLAAQLIINENLVSKQQCVLMQDDANGIIQYVEQQGCRVKGLNHYQYLIEDLGIFNCLVIKKEEVFFASRHLRLTLIKQSDNEGKQLLQLRRIYPSSIKTSCIKGVKRISAGLYGWRFTNL